MSTNFGIQMSTLEQKRAKLETFMETLKKDKDKITTASEAVQKESNSKFMELKRIVEEKEKEMEEAIKRMEAAKQGTVNSEIAKAQQRIQKIDESISIVQEALCEKTPLAFLQKMEDAEEQVRHSAMAPDLEVKQKWFQMIPLNIQYAEQTLRNMKYKERMNQYGLYEQEEPDIYSDDEEY